MGLVHSIFRLCTCSGRPERSISPSNISHPYPLMAKPPHAPAAVAGAGASSSFRPISQIHSTRGKGKQYQTLHSPVASNSDASTSTSTPATYPRVPERAFIRHQHHRESGSGSGRSRKLKKPRMVEGDWELVRRNTQAGDWPKEARDISAAAARSMALLADGEREPEGGAGGKEGRTVVEG